MPRERPARFVAVLTLFAAGAALCLWYGRLGFMPLDQSIVFDGGWRVVSGQRPYADFLTPSGLVPILIQAACFMLLGVSWWTFVLHAGVVNGLFGIVAWAILRTAGARPLHAWVFALLSTVVFYPPFGVPYPDQHSFFFAACCLLGTMRAWRAGGALPVAAAVLCGALAGLSKPAPAAFVVVPCGLAILVMLARRRPGAGAGFATGVATAASLSALYVALAGVRLDEAFYYGMVLPIGTASGRTVMSEAFWNTTMGFPAVMPMTPWVIHGAGALVLLSAATARGADPEGARRAVGLWLLAEGLILVSLLFAAVTNNQLANALAFQFLATGLAVTAAQATVDSAGWRARGRTARLAGGVFLALALAGSAFDAWRFNTLINATRSVHDQVFATAPPRWSPGGRLALMTLNDSWRAPDLRPIIRYVENRPDHFVLVGDSSVLYGATGHPSILPVLWFHPGLTMPRVDSPRFAEFERRLAERLATYDVRYAIVESPRTLMSVSLRKLPVLAARTEGCQSGVIGAWTVVELCR